LELLKYELYKIYSRKMIYVALIGFLIIYLLYAWDLVSRTDYGIHNNSNIGNFLKETQGPLTLAKAETAEQELATLRAKSVEAYAKAGGTPSDEVFIYRHALSSEDRFKLAVYSDIILTWSRLEHQKTLQRHVAERLASMRAERSVEYQYREAALHYRMLTGLAPAVFYYRRGWQEIIDFFNTFGIIFMGGLILLSLSPVFSEEYSTNMDSLLLSSKHGKRKLVTVKLIASTITVLSFVVFFAAVNVGVNAFIFGLSGSSSRLQELIKYFASPFDLTLGSYFLVQLIVHALGSSAFGLLVLLISVFSRSPLTPFFIGGAVYGIPIFFNSILRLEGAWVRALVDFSYTQAVKVEDLFLNFRAFNVFGFPVLFVYVLGAFILSISIAVLIGIYQGFRSRQVV